MWNPAQKLSITEEELKTLKAWVAAKTSPQRTVLRARICLLAAEGLPNRAIAKALKTSRPTVVQWRKRFEERGSQGLAEDAPHGLSSRALPAAKIKAIVGGYAADDASRCDSLVYADDGRSCGCEQRYHLSNLGCARVATAPRGRV